MIRRDPEAIGELIADLRTAHPEKTASERADIVMLRDDIPEMPPHESTVTRTQAQYYTELLAEAKVDINAFDLAQEKGWIEQGVAFEDYSAGVTNTEVAKDKLRCLYESTLQGRCRMRADHSGPHRFLVNGTAQFSS